MQPLHQYAMNLPRPILWFHFSWVGVDMNHAQFIHYNNFGSPRLTRAFTEARHHRYITHILVVEKKWLFSLSSLEPLNCYGGIDCPTVSSCFHVWSSGAQGPYLELRTVPLLLVTAPSISSRREWTNEEGLVATLSRSMHASACYLGLSPPASVRSWYRCALMCDHQ